MNECQCPDNRTGMPGNERQWPDDGTAMNSNGQIIERWGGLPPLASVAGTKEGPLCKRGQEKKAEPRPAPGEQAPPQDSGGGGSRPHADRTPGWKRGGRQAVLAAGIAPPQQDRRTLPCNIVSGASPAGAADSSPPGYEPLGALGRRALPSGAPFITPWKPSADG